MSTDTGKARLPALPPVSTGNPALDQWMRAVSERLEVREGNRGNPFERVVLQRELVALGLDQAQWGRSSGTAVASVMVQAPSGQFSRVPLDAFSDELRKTRLYRDLQKSISDASRFDTVPDTVRSILLASLADEAAQRGADIQRLEGKVQTAEQSLAYTVQEITAAVAGAQAGVREVTYASATANEATAGKVAQLVASLDGTGSATLAESLAVIASRTEGLSSQYMLKLGAGNAVASIGLMASEDPDGDTESAFIVEAGRFGLVAPYTFVQETTPSATVIGQTWYTPSSKVSKRATATGTGSWATFTPTVPFGVDATTGEVFINGSLKINAGGSALQDAASGADGQGVVKGVSFLRAATLPTTPTGGSFASPNATGWSDGVPADNNQPLWMTTRLFTSDGLTPQQSVWTTPAKVGTPATGAKVQFSGDGSTSWHDTPTTNDYYMRSGTSADNGATWTWEGAVKIKGEQGIQGPIGTGTTGPTGSRGTIVTKITTAWTDAAGYNQIYAIASAAGMTPTYPIKGDIVSYTGGAKECTAAGNPGTWTDVLAYINGSMILTGTLGADKIAAGTVTATVNFETAGWLEVGGYRPAALFSASGLFNKNLVADIGVLGYAGSGIGVGLAGHGGSISGACGVRGTSTSASGVGVSAVNTSGGNALLCDGPGVFLSSLQCNGSINAVGNVTAYGSSDTRLKKNIRRITSPLAKLEQLRGVTFDWRAAFIKDNGGEDGYFVRKHDVGVIAQEVQAVQPEIVAQRQDGMLAVKYEKLVPLLIEAVKELSAQVKVLQR